MIEEKGEENFEKEIQKDTLKEQIDVFFNLQKERVKIYQDFHE